VENQLKELPDNVQRCLTDFINTAKEACGENLVSIVLFGSAAEGRLRPTSDVNLMPLRRTYTQKKPF
jgi:predicted nucleotidyltransferase